MLGKIRARRNLLTGWHPRDVDDMLFYGVFGVILGGRLGYVLFYKPLYYAAHPLEIFAVWQGGMSFHGGFLGVLAALWVYARVRRKRWLEVTDFVAPLCPLGLGAGRIGNFINGELVGRVSDVPWAMVFPQVDSLPRHPSQLYNSALEGLLLFVILWTYASRPRPLGAVSGLFLLGYGTLRFIEEYAREPDAFLGLSRGRAHDGTVALAADDRDRLRDDVVGLSARREAGADRHRPNEVAARAARPEGRRASASRRSRPTAGRRSAKRCKEAESARAAGPDGRRASASRRSRPTRRRCRSRKEYIEAEAALCSALQVRRDYPVGLEARPTGLPVTR